MEKNNYQPPIRQTPAPPVYTGAPSMNNPAANPYTPPYPMQPAQGIEPVPKPLKKPMRKSKPRDLVMALIVAVMSFAVIDCLFWSGGLGIGFSIGGAVLLFAALWYLKPSMRKKSVYIAAIALLCVAGYVSFVFSADSFIKALTLVSLMIGYICILMDAMDLRAYAAGTLSSFSDFFYTAFASSFGKIGQGMYALFHLEKKEGSKRGKSVAKALIGLAVALPVVIVLLILLSSGDQAFHGMIDGISFEKFPEKLLTLFFAVPVFIFLYSQLFSLPDCKREKKEESKKGLDPIILTFFLVGVSLVYVAYLFSQLAYFFSGFMGFLPDGFTYAEYARRGFFELSAVSVINIVIVILADAFSKKKDGRLPLSVKLLSLFLCVFSLVLAGTEIAKMKMYMDSYGLTRLRILTTIFMIFLAVVFLALMVHIFVRKFPYFKTAVVVGMLLTIAMNFVSVDRMVANYNVWAYETGALKTVDVGTISELGDAAVPALLKLAQDHSGKTAMLAKHNLCDRWKNLHERGDFDYQKEEFTIKELKPYDYRGFNLVSYRARQLLLDNVEVFSDLSAEA